MRLIVIRHGQSFVNITEDWSKLDNLDTVLTDLGHQQAAALRDWLKAQNVTADVLYTSTLLRTQETAEYVAEALSLDAIPEPRIREIGSNYADGLPIDYDDMPRTFSKLPGFRAPFLERSTDPARVETWMHFRTRVGIFLEEIISKHDGQTVYIVAHGGVITAIFEHLFNTGPRRFLTVETHNTGWTEIEHRTMPEGDKLWALIYHNRIDHLTNF